MEERGLELGFGEEEEEWYRAMWAARVSMSCWESMDHGNAGGGNGVSGPASGRCGAGLGAFDSEAKIEE